MVDLKVYKFRPQGIEKGNQCGHHKLNFRKGGFKSYLWNQEKKHFSIWVLTTTNWLEIGSKRINFRVVECLLSNHGNF